MSKAFLEVLNGKRLDPPPIWLMRQAGRYLPEYRDLRRKAGGFLKLCYTPDFAVDVTMQPIERFGLDAAILFSDILVVPDGLGQKVSFVEGTGPVLEPVRNADDVSNLSINNVLDKLPPIYDTVSILSRCLGSKTALIGFAGPRVIKQTIRQDLPEGFQTSEFLLESGFVDRIVHRHELRNEIGRIIDYAGK